MKKKILQDRENKNSAGLPKYSFSSVVEIKTFRTTIYYLGQDNR